MTITRAVWEPSHGRIVITLENGREYIICKPVDILLSERIVPLVRIDGRDGRFLECSGGILHGDPAISPEDYPEAAVGGSGPICALTTAPAVALGVLAWHHAMFGSEYPLPGYSRELNVPSEDEAERVIRGMRWVNARPGDKI